MAGFWENPAVVGLIIAIPASILGYLGYRRSRRVDEVAKQAGMADSHATSIGQVVDGLNKVIAAVQSDNHDLRKEVLELRATVDPLRKTVEEIRARLDLVETGNIDLRAKNRELERENSVLHAENEAFKIEIATLKARIDELERVNGQ